MNTTLRKLAVWLGIGVTLGTFSRPLSQAQLVPVLPSPQAPAKPVLGLPALAPSPPAMEEIAGDIRDIRGPVNVPDPWRLLLLAGAIILLIALLIWLIRRYLRKRGATPEIAIIPPYERALSELAAARRLLETGQDTKFIIHVSDCLRKYLEGQFDVPAPERTTEEFLAEISQHTLLAGNLAKAMQKFLQLCDLVKFARRPLGLTQMRDAFDNADKIIRESYVKLKMQEALLARKSDHKSGGEVETTAMAS